MYSTTVLRNSLGGEENDADAGEKATDIKRGGERSRGSRSSDVDEGGGGGQEEEGEHVRGG